MDLWHLKVFQKVIEEKGFSKASRIVNLTQPTISNHIKELENYYGCRLVDRLGKQTLATQAGLLLYEYAGKILALFEETDTAMAEFLGNVKGRLSVGGSTIPGNYLLPRKIGQFIQRYPDAKISIVIGDTDQMIHNILDYRLDLAIVGAQSDHSQILQEKLTQDEMALIVPKNHQWADKSRITVDMLSRVPFIIREPGSGTLTSIEKSFAKTGRDLSAFKISAQLGSTAAVIEGIKNNVGVSILSTLAVEAELAAGSLKALAVKGVNLKRNFYLTRHKGRDLSPLCRAFTEFLQEQFNGKA